jgi:hypothetical protein
MVYSITCFIVPCSHFYFLNASLVSCSLHISILQVLCWSSKWCSMLSQGIPHGVSVSHFWHIVICCPFLIVPGLGHLSKRKTFEKWCGREYKKFSRCKHFFNIHIEARWDRFNLENQNDVLFYFEGRKQNLRVFLVYSKPRVSIL